MEDKNQKMEQQQDNKAARGLADIVLLIDVTGSMQPALDGVKESLNNFAELLDGKLTKDQAKIDWRGKVIGYRDFDVDKEAAFEDKNSFVSDVASLKTQIVGLSASGGEDFEESALDALFLVATKTEWRQKAHKFIVMFTDASSKENISSKNLEPGEKDNVDYVIQKMMEKKIKLVLVAPTDKKGIYKKLNMLPKSKFYSVGNENEPQVYEGLKNQNFDELLEMIAATISASASEPVVA